MVGLLVHLNLEVCGYWWYNRKVVVGVLFALGFDESHRKTQTMGEQIRHRVIISYTAVS